MSNYIVVNGEAFSDSIIVSILDAKKSYIVSIKPKSWSENEAVLDGFFKVSKVDGKLSEYSPVMDPDEFGYALKHPIYLRYKS